MDFDLTELLAARRGESFALHDRYLNPQQAKVLHAIGFDKTYVRAEGASLFDADGNEYLDFLSGFGVFALGRNHPVVRRALHDALDANLAEWVQFDCPPLPGLLAERLLAHAPGLDRVFFCNSGAEAVEAALKFARHATGRDRILYCDRGFHGLTLGALSANGSDEFRAGFGALLPATRIPFGDLDALAAGLRTGDVAALIVEPIQGHGMAVPPPGYLTTAVDLLHSHGALLICDEVQTGLGRTGTFFAYQSEPVHPDLVTVAKALSGGYVPVGAMLTTDRIFSSVYSSMDRLMVHSSTFKGGTLAMAAGLATLAVLESEALTTHADRLGATLRAALTDLAADHDILGDVRGRGLMLGLEFTRPTPRRARAIWSTMQKARVGLFSQMIVAGLFHRHRILTQVSGDHMEVIKLIPPLTLTDTQAAHFLTAFTDVLTDATKPTGLPWEFGRTLTARAVRR
ncbi:aminotransferase class III-fold pyridoxal phosphate-dependent enzyme [Nocardia sp. ET3-3]|uniref:Aminotransferase class III-fold pyridoxal phosphate-dependent enzyme n=1 Tax=Nocardia terrae TaxID=2675851 RepID=A0A7K1V9U4_9NOCA|nr:aspartate aminotransferase family protein [Nocardia terrae]MVU83415.1 aminotransferase class III-fold pyridoxal phosphate-dependent enzyme [Nocardia terrae]